MLLITESQVRAALSLPAALTTLRKAFEQLGRGQAAVLPRSRASADTAGGTLMISAMGAVLPDVLGTKVYSTRQGQFQFLINLFDAATGAPLATLEANELTRVRTAATTALAVAALAPAGARTLALFGAGVQAQAHAEALLASASYERLLLCARSGGEAFAAALSREHGLPVQLVSAEEAARQGDVIVTCTRASEPLFDGRWVRDGALVAAVGSSKPVARELDDALLSRAAQIVVEWAPAARAEAGELVRAAPGVVDEARLIELGRLLVEAPARVGSGPVVYKSVGIGLEDVALARLVWSRLQAQEV